MGCGTSRKNPEVDLPKKENIHQPEPSSPNDQQEQQEQYEDPENLAVPEGEPEPDNARVKKDQKEHKKKKKAKSGKEPVETKGNSNKQPDMKQSDAKYPEAKQLDVKQPDSKKPAGKQQQDTKSTNAKQVDTKQKGLKESETNKQVMFEPTETKQDRPLKLDFSLSQDMPEMQQDKSMTWKMNGLDLSPIHSQEEINPEIINSPQMIIPKAEEIKKPTPTYTNNAKPKTIQPNNQNNIEKKPVPSVTEPINQLKPADQATNQKKETPIKEKKIIIRQTRTSSYNWPDEGQVEIKTICFKLKYNYILKGFRILKPNDRYVTSILQWKRSEENDGFDFSLKDIEVTELKDGNGRSINHPPVIFFIDFNGNFVDILNMQDIISYMTRIQKKNTMSKDRKEKLTKNLKNEIQKMWFLFAGSWLNLNKANHNGNKNMLISTLNNCGKDCGLLSNSEIITDIQLKNEVKDKLLDQNKYYKFLGSRYLIKNNMKKWELDRDSIPKVQIRKLDNNNSQSLDNDFGFGKNTNNNNQINYDNQLRHRNLKLNFFLTSKYISYTTLTELNTLRPHVTNFEESKKLAFEVNGDLYLNIQYETRANVFQWLDVPELSKEENVISEFTKFQDSCEQIFKDLILELSYYPKIPLSYKIKPRNNHQNVLDAVDENQPDQNNNPNHIQPLTRA